MNNASDELSLLWPNGKKRQFRQNANASLIADLNLNPVIRALSRSGIDERLTRAILLDMCQDANVIRYRQAIISDLIDNEALIEKLDLVLQMILDLEAYLTIPQWQDNTLRRLAWRLSELENYVNCLDKLHHTLQDSQFTLKSEGLTQLQARVRAMVEESTFQMLRSELPELIPKLRSVVSVTVGINLDDEMRPLSAVLLSFHTTPFRGESLMKRLFRRNQPDEYTGAGTLHDARDLNVGGARFEVELNDRSSPFMPALFRDLSILLDDTSRPIVTALKKYTQISSAFLISLKQELAFYLGSTQLIIDLQRSGLPLCQPEILPADDRHASIEEIYNLNLALMLRGRQENLSDEVIRNDVLFADQGRIYILTGPNQGGKTTYTQAVGLAQILAQAGLHVPAQSASISPVDAIFTHFATEERPDLEAGRLGEEARRLNQIFQQATPHSLILMNESLSSTSASESLYIAREVIGAIRILGARAIFATHLHELAAQCAEINEEIYGDSLIQSVVSRVQIVQNEAGNVIKRTYKITPGPPMSRSYAVELASRYGISLAQIETRLRERGVITSGAEPGATADQ